MDSKRHKELLEKWSGVEDYQRLAVELWKVTNGDARQLAGTHAHETSAFGRAANNLFDENVELHRYLLWSIWKSNKGDIREHFAMVARQEGQRKKLRSTPYGSKEKSKEIMCWCRFSIEVTEGKNLGTVKCSQCKQHFHSICAGFSEEETAQSEGYVCLQCTNTPLIPKLFLEPLRTRKKDEGSADQQQPKSKATPGRLVNKIGKILFSGSSRIDSKAASATLSQDEQLSLGKDVSGDDLLAPSQSTSRSDDESLLSIKSDKIGKTDDESDSDFDVIPKSLSPKKSESNKEKRYSKNSERRVHTQMESSESDTESSVKSIKKNKSTTHGHPGCTKTKVKMDSSDYDTASSVSSSDIKGKSVDPRKKSRQAQSDPVAPVKDSNGLRKNCAGGPSRIIGARVDVSRIPVKWVRNLSKLEYGEICAFDEEKKKWGFALNYGDALQDRLTERNEVCVIRTTKRELIQPGDDDFPNRQFFAVYAECVGKYCSARFSFNIKKYPVDINSVEMVIKVCGGKLKHFEGEENKRNLSGKRREEVKNELIHDLPSNVFRKRWSKADISKVQKGNIDEVKKLKIIQQCRVEKRKENDHHKDVLQDLLATMNFLAQRNISARVPGYMQDCAIKPLKVILFSMDSLQLFRKFAREGKVTLFLDSTANVAKAIEYPSFASKMNNDSKQKKKNPRIFYYALVVKSQSGKPVPILEFFTDKQDYLPIMYCMESFFQKYKKLYNVRSFDYNVSRVEIDFSLASLSAITRVFCGQDVEQYLRSVWIALRDERKMKFTVHICRIHTVKFLTKYFETAFKAARVWHKGSSYFLRWINRFVAAKRMDEVSQLFEEIFMVLIFKFKTPEIEAIFAGNYQGTLWSGWKAFNIDGIDQDAPFCRRTPFGAFLNDMANKIYDKMSELEQLMNDLPPNIFSNEQIMGYLLEKMAAYATLLTKVHFYLTDSVIRDDTTNPGEYWFKVFKTDILQGQRHQKLSRVIRALADNVQGAINEAHSKFPIANNDVLADPTDDSSESEIEDKISPKSKRVLSPDEAVDQFKTEKTKRSETSSTILNEMELIPSGGIYEGTKLHNTCSFDCILQALYYLYHYTDFGRMFMDDLMEEGGVARYLPDLFDNISKRKFSKAKAMWIRFFLKKEVTGRSMDLWEEEIEQGLKPLKGFFPVIQRVDCPNTHCRANEKSPRQLDSNYFLSARQKDFAEVLEIGNKKTCKTCKTSKARYYYNMKAEHNYGVFAYAHVGMERKYRKIVDKKGKSHYELEKLVPAFPESQLELKMDIFNTNFRVVCYTIYNGVHYKLVIVQPTHRLIYDGQHAEKLHKWSGPDDKYAISTIWLSPIQHSKKYHFD